MYRFRDVGRPAAKNRHAGPVCAHAKAVCAHADSAPTRASRARRRSSPLAAAERLERRLCLAGSISGQTFRDHNGNNVLDAGEPALNGVTVYLDLDASGDLSAPDRTALTAVSGSYGFTELADGTYPLGAVTPANFVRTGPAFQPITISGGNAVAGKDIGFFPTLFTGSDGTDSFTFRLDPTDATRFQFLETLLGSGTVTYSIAKNALAGASITLAANSGDDMITVDLTNGSPLPAAGGLRIDAGPQSTPNADRLTITGSAGADGVVLKNLDLVSPAAGAGAIALKGVERVTVNGAGGADALAVGPSVGGSISYDGGNGAFTDVLSFTGTDNADVVTLTANSLTEGASTVTFAQVETITVNGGDGNDVLNASFAPAGTVFAGGTDPADTDTLNVNGGAFTFSADAATTTANLAIHVAAPASVQFNATQHLASLNVAGQATLAQGGGRVIVTRALDVAGKLDLGDNDLVLDYAPGGESPLGVWNGSVYTGIAGRIASGRNGGAWNGNGIMTSAETEGGRFMLGVVEASELFQGQTGVWSGEPVDSTALLIKFTYAGDADKNGVLDSDDYFAIDSTFNLSGTTSVFYTADFDLNGAIDSDDYFWIDSGWRGQGSPL